MAPHYGRSKRLAAKNTLSAVDAERVKQAFQSKLATVMLKA